MKSLSAPNVQPVGSRDSIQVSEALRLPEVSGQQPMGVSCGAIGPDFVGDKPLIDPDSYCGPEHISCPVSSHCCKSRGDDMGSPYRYCEDDILTDECDSVADMIRQGCNICFDMVRSGRSIEINLDYDDPCELMNTNPDPCYTLLRGIDYDADTDGDGVNDSWSALFGFNAVRTRIYDVELE